MRFQLATVIVPATAAANIRALANKLEKSDLAAGIFTVGLSATGTGTATHYISSGWFPKPFLKLMRNPTLMFNTAKAAWQADGDVFPLTQAQVTNRLNACSVVMAGDYIPAGQTVPIARVPAIEGASLPESPHAQALRLGLKFIQGALP